MTIAPRIHHRQFSEDFNWTYDIVIDGEIKVIKSICTSAVYFTNEQTQLIALQTGCLAVFHF